ncbi:MAG: SusC/RagA family TonB-linked outer membrane protein, partial [Muribaculaceae bacterium]|nr:SusC/RagA family TonB-linked outer membrane protein [Muribaculaceae bacterium]
MKKQTITLICLMLLPMALFAQGNKVTINAKQQALTAALRQVEQQSGYYKVNYPYEAVKDYQVTANVKNAAAPDAVNVLIKGLPLASRVDGRFIYVTKSDRLAEEGGAKRTVKGRVVDADGEPLIGVTVHVKGTDNGVATDLDGNYSLNNVDPNSTLVFSYIGKKPVERKATANNSVLILEDDANVLDDVVVTGYQQISKERATGSFAKVTAEQLKTKRYDNLSQLLEGEVAGFNTQSGLIRGTTTMNGVTNPLYVIDGFPVESTRYDEYGYLNENVPNVNIDDIESVTVLKDAAAASIYGARAANGVVVIVTKKAKGKRTSVTFNTSLTWHPYAFNKDRLTDAADIIDLEREWAVSNPNLQGEGAVAYAQSIIDDKVYTSQGIQTIANYYAGNITQAQMEQTLGQLASRGYRYYDDVAKYAKRTAFYQQYHLGVGRDTENNNFMASLTYRINKFNDKFSKDNSWAIDLRDMLDITPWLKATFGSYTYYGKNTEQSFDPMSPGYSYMPYDRLRNDDGTNYTSTQGARLGQSDLGILGAYNLYSMDITPLDEIGRNLRTTNEFINRTYGKLDITLPYSLKYNVMFQYEYAYDKTRQLYDKNSYYVRNLVNQYATDDYGTGEATYNVPFGNIYYRANQTSKAYTFRQQLNFDRTYADKHNVVALLGHEVRKTVVDYDNNTLYNYDPDMLTFSLVDQNVLNNTYGLMGGYGLYDRDFAYMRYIDNRFVSFFGNAAYTYDNKYMLSASIRWDRSNLWGTGSKYQNKPIWSIGAAWNIDHESWFNVAWINRLKLRASYGIAGNIAKDAAPYMTAAYYQNY